MTWNYNVEGCATAADSCLLS
ncbi:rCG50318 [Rattus norvegicus]|uniref:RCG50318 n=1 Tax=Rattus norvegicus TaxID=10116 RepID=A6JYP2_RAT|nr:rCG50318 [Rattus norvegicus]